MSSKSRVRRRERMAERNRAERRKATARFRLTVAALALISGAVLAAVARLVARLLELDEAGVADE